MKQEKKVEYQNLIIKFFAGEISDSEMILLKTWLDQNSDNRHIFNDENELWQEVSVHTKLIHFKTDTGWMNISSRLNLGNNNRKSITDFPALILKH